MIDEGPTRALREQSPDVLRAELRNVVLESEEVWLRDWRDLLVALAPYHDCARRLGLDPTVVFDEAAEEAAADLQEIIRRFGRRRDVTPRGFGFKVVDAPVGPQYEIVFPNELGWIA
jgi:hypothetical protein